jgi:hypothetical protein
MPELSRLAGRALQRPKLRTYFFVNLRRRAGGATRFAEWVSAQSLIFSTISTSITPLAWKVGGMACKALASALRKPLLDFFELAKNGKFLD